MLSTPAQFAPTDLGSFHFSPGGGVCVTYTGSGAEYEQMKTYVPKHTEGKCQGKPFLCKKEMGIEICESHIDSK